MHYTVFVLNCDMQTLNPAQQQAVLHRFSPLLVISGPGTGKTRVLVERIKHLIVSESAPPESILAITFTVNAAAEILKRLNHINATNSLPMVTTFHGWAYAFLREQGAQVDIIGEKEALVIFKELNESVKPVGLKSQAAVSLLKDISLAYQQYPPVFGTPELETLAFKYQEYKRANNLYDYDDLLHRAIELLRQPEQNAAFRRRLRFILVDEFQDINSIQYELVKLMAFPNGEITAIGDPNQAIYSFRGAEPRFVTSFKQEFADVKTVFLDTSYRTPQRFLDGSCAVLKESSPRLYSAKGEGALIQHNIFEDEQAEAKWIADIITRKCGICLETIRGSEHRQFSDFAVITRLNSVSERLANLVQKKGIPCESRVGLMERLSWLEPLSWTWRMAFGFTEQKRHIFLKMAQNELAKGQKMGNKLDERYKSILTAAIFFARNLDYATLPNEPAKLFELLERALSLDLCEGVEAIVLKAIKTAIGTLPEAQIRDIEPLFKDEARLLGIKPEAVRFLTIHAAKGMEFPVVFLIGMEEGMLPLKGADINEERRLCYVAMTRASSELYLTSVLKRPTHGRSQGQPSSFLPSSFLMDMPSGIMSTSQVKTKLTKKQVQKKLF